MANSVLAPGVAEGGSPIHRNEQSIPGENKAADNQGNKPSESERQETLAEVVASLGLVSASPPPDFRKSLRLTVGDWTNAYEPTAKMLPSASVHLRARWPPDVKAENPLINQGLPLQSESHALLALRAEGLQLIANYEGDDTESLQWRRVWDVDAVNRVLTLVSIETLLPADNVDGATHSFPRCSYRGQIVAVKANTSVVSGIPRVPSVTRNLGFQGSLEFIFVQLGVRATLLELLAIIDALAEEADFSGIHALTLLLPAGVSRLMQERAMQEMRKWNASRPPLTIMWVGGRDPLRFDLINEAEHGAFSPLVATAVDIATTMGPRSLVKDRLTLMDLVAEECVKQRHLLPSAWCSTNPPSLCPVNLPFYRLNPTMDQIVVFPGKGDLSIGRLGNHVLIALPARPAAVRVSFSNDNGRPAQLPLIKRLQISVAALKVKDAAVQVLGDHE